MERMEIIMTVIIVGFLVGIIAEAIEYRKK